MVVACSGPACCLVIAGLPMTFACCGLSCLQVAAGQLGLVAFHGLASSFVIASSHGTDEVGCWRERVFFARLPATASHTVVIGVITV